MTSSRRTRFLLAASLLLMAWPMASRAMTQQTIQVLDPESKPAELMEQWWDRQIRAQIAARKTTLASRTGIDAIHEYQQKTREFFVQQLGGFPQRTPLNPRVTGILQRKGFRVEKILFESQPGLVVSSALFLPEPDEFPPPWPAALVVCGHSANGKAYPAYQTACASLALHGIAALIIDPIGQGERYQHLDEEGRVELVSTTAGHSLLGMGSMLLGQNVARFEIWDGMRAIDYLQSREDIDREKIGCLGNSGGGTQTSYLMALDDRIVAASPSCYLTSFEKLLSTIGPQDAEQNIHGQLAFGMDHADYLMMRAPTPILICSATRDFFDIDGTWESFRSAKQIYGRLGYPERIDLVETDDQHGWSQPLREAAVQWMVRWLAGRDIVVREPAIEPIAEQELWATPRGQVLLLPDARSGFDLNVAENERLADQRRELWRDRESGLAKVRQLAGIRPLHEIPRIRVTLKNELRQNGVRISSLLFQTGDEVPLPALLYRPLENADTSPPILFVHEVGKEGTAATHTPAELAAEGLTVLAVDLRGTGETKPADGVWYDERFGEDARHLMIAYLLGRNYVGMRAEDLLACARWLAERNHGAGTPVRLVSIGEVNTSALHAAALEPELFESVSLSGGLESWSGLVGKRYSRDQLAHVVHGGLTAYDLADLRKVIAEKLEWTEARNPRTETPD